MLQVNIVVVIKFNNILILNPIIKSNKKITIILLKLQPYGITHWCLKREQIELQLITLMLYFLSHNSSHVDW